MAESDNCVDEIELSATDIMLAKLTLSPCHTSTQLSVSADPPIKHGTKAKGRTKKANTSFCVQQCKHNGRETDSMVQCHLCQLWVHYECVGERPETIIGLWSCQTCRKLPATVVQLVNTVAKLEATLMQLKDNNAELVQLVKDQCNINDVIRSENTALIQQVATLRIEAHYNDDIRAVHEKLDKLSSDIESLTQPTSGKKSHAAVARCKRSVLMYDEQILRNMNTVTTADNEEVELHKASKATPKYLLVAVQWSDVCKNADELTIVCSDGITENANMEELKQDFSDLITTATEDIKRVNISSVLPSTAGAQDDKIQEINNFIRNKCRDTGAKFVDNDNNFLFRDGSCDTSAFKSDGICLSANGVMHNLSLRHLSHRDDGTGYNKARPTGNRSSKQQRRMSSAHLLSQEGRDTPNATGKRPPKHKRNSPDSRPTGAGHRAAAEHVRIAGQCNKCGETNHVTRTCRHVNAVSCFVCGQKGHKSKHHVNMD